MGAHDALCLALDSPAVVDPFLCRIPTVFHAFEEKVGESKLPGQFQDALCAEIDARVMNLIAEHSASIP